MDQARLARLVLAHRGKLERVAAIDPGSSDWLLIACLRLAVVVHRARDARGIPPITMAREGRGFSVNTTAGWLQKLPLTAAALDEEQRQWMGVGRGLYVRAMSARTAA
jgi:exopolyphosphatase/guanosine-5'-triphosphate,3'-diphosphate pyrophosphatase